MNIIRKFFKTKVSERKFKALKLEKEKFVEYATKEVLRKFLHETEPGRTKIDLSLEHFVESKIENIFFLFKVENKRKMSMNTYHARACVTKVIKNLRKTQVLRHREQELAIRE